MKATVKAARRKQRVFQHLVLALTSALGVALIYHVVLTRESATQWLGPMFPWSMATGYVGLALCGLTLLLGPLNLLRRRPNPISSYLRRDMGIWGGAISIVHVAFGLQVHAANILENFFTGITDGARFGFRVDLWGIANYLGLASTTIIVLLLALSNDISIRRLRWERWKALQHWNYVLFGLIVVHGMLYQWIEKRLTPYLALLVVVGASVMLGQSAGYWRRTVAVRETQVK